MIVEQRCLSGPDQGEMAQISIGWDRRKARFYAAAITKIKRNILYSHSRDQRIPSNPDVQLQHFAGRLARVGLALTHETMARVRDQRERALTQVAS